MACAFATACDYPVPARSIDSHRIVIEGSRQSVIILVLLGLALLSGPHLNSGTAFFGVELGMARPKSATSLKEFGSYLRDLRRKFGLNQREACKRLNSKNIPLSQSALAQYESGKILDLSSQLLRAISEVFEVPYADLVAKLVEEKYSQKLPGLSGVTTFGFTDQDGLGARFGEATAAKQALARYCTSTESNFWRTNDRTFVESGTIGALLLHQFVATADPSIWPREITTNCLALSTAYHSAVALIRQNRGEFSPDNVRFRLIGGIAVDGVGAVCPDYDNTPFVEELRRLDISHVVLMATRFTADEGPCYALPQWKQLKTDAIKHALTSKNARLTVVLEATKICPRGSGRGWSTDDGLAKSAKQWPKLLRKGCVSVITALSGTSQASRRDFVVAQLQELRSAGASCVMLGEDGNPEQV